MDNKNKIRYFKRNLERKVNKAEYKRKRLEQISSVIHESFINLSKDHSSLDNESQSKDNSTEDNSTEEAIMQENNVERSEDGSNSYDYNNFNNNYDVSDNDDDHFSNNSSDRHDSDDSESTNCDQNLNDDQIDFHIDNEEEKEAYLIKVLRTWALEGGLISMRKLDSLLVKLKPLFPNIPLSYKTLLETPSSIQIIQIDGGQLWYKGITENLNSMNLEDYLKIYKKIVIDVNADGLPLFKSSRKHFWPLLGRLVGTNNQPFVILLTLLQNAVVPKLDQFLHHFVEEVHYLQENGYMYNNQRFEFSIKNFICDAPARSFMKGIVEHGAYFACEKCTVEGEWVDNRMTYPKLNESLRTDESFINRNQPYHHRHHQSPLEELGIGMVSQFPLDGMHLVYLGVFKRLLFAWQKWNGPWKLHASIVTKISAELLVAKITCPQDFNRKPRNFNELHYYKATEFRRLLLYDGIVVLKDHLNTNIYKHFLLLHCAIFILSSPSLVHTYCHYAEELLNTFISHSVKIYGHKFVVYNVHCLSHLAQECYLNGDLESFTAFAFENKLKSLKQTLKSGYKPLEQAAFRDIESSKNIDIIMNEKNNQVALSMRHFYENEILNGQQYKKMIINDVVFQLNEKDSCIKMNNEDVITIANIVQREDQVFLIGHAFLKAEDFYQYPISSSVLGILKVSQKDEQRRIFSVNDIKAKCWLIPYKKSYICIPLLHSNPLFN